MTEATILERVCQQLGERDQGKQPRDEDEGGSPLVLSQRITLKEFDALLGEHESDFPPWDYEPDPDAKDGAGRVLVHDLSSPIHAAVTANYLRQIKITAGAAAGTNPIPALVGLARYTMGFEHYRFEPNGSLAPANRIASPTFELEVAYSEATVHLRQKLRNYMQCPVALGIKDP
ncbi:hypothetical protein PHYSODRAFT_293185 [Phytophthora sojae]|uniref:Uncharacterized protein n=1 Tax=Phytophthora sojae (strain P6497) TaxID=1094619 RepID=G4YJZ6_PHYSP|nr:hypothetical protein PHYSODRAFT_293185 [Phytophthora sojae]EGZ27128.1 hypothetical protein PHYSODRAFT_293185 [Phytophthora sojae]|eukprot:XP_009514403.1 hypothetical protein PHYSODRAFT_293185 [Phytophthora sojae]